jgi:hypothetical protein
LHRLKLLRHKLAHQISALPTSPQTLLLASD